MGEPAGPLLRLWWAVVDLALAYNYQLFLGVRLIPERHIALLLPLLAVILILLRRHVSFRWIFTALALTAPPLFIIMLTRKDPEVWQVSRYAYESFTFWAVLFGALLDAILVRFERWPRHRAAFLALLAIPAAVYWAGHRMVAEWDRKYFSTQPATLQAFWFGWESFFRFASENRAEAGKPLRLPYLWLAPRINLQTVFVLCHPRGLPGLTFDPGVAGTEQEQEEFWSEVHRARARLPLFRHLPVSPEDAARDPHF